MTTKERLTLGQKITLGLVMLASSAIIITMIFLLVTPPKRTPAPASASTHPVSVEFTGSKPAAKKAQAEPAVEPVAPLPAEEVQISVAPVAVTPAPVEAPAQTEADARADALRSAGFLEEQIPQAIHLIFELKADNRWAQYFNVSDPDLNGSIEHLKHIRAHVLLKYGNLRNAMEIAQSFGAW